MKRLSLVGAALLLALSCAVRADPVPELDYQGKVLVNDLPFHGTGYFKFALASAAGVNLWANDSTPAGEPNAYLALSVVNGVFSVVLGSMPVMTNPIPLSVFATGTGLYLRVWFGSTTNAFSEMLPAQRLVTSAYAMHAHLLDGLHATSIVAQATNAVTLAGDVAGPVGNVQIQANAVTTSEIAGDTIAAADIAPNAVGTSEIADGVVASIDLADNSIANVDISTTAGILGSKLQAGSLTNAGALQLAAGSTGAQAVATGHPFLNAYGRVNTLVAPTPNTLLSIVGAGAVYVSNLPPATVLIGAPAASAAALSNLDHVVWVATNGTAVGPGTIDKPYDTPQNGYNAAAARYAGMPATVVLAAGTYAGGLNMNAANVHVIGVGRPVIASLSAMSAAVAVLNGKQRIEGLVIRGPVLVAASGTGVKFYNTRMLGGLQINGNQVEVQNCHITQTDGAGAAYAVLVGNGQVFATDIGFYHSSIEYALAGGPAVQVSALVRDFEMLWNEIVCTGGGPAILDNENSGPLYPVHLYAHNWIKGPGPDGINPTVADPLSGQTGHTIGFYNNTVFGHVGVNGSPQYYGNNMVYGRINFIGAAPIGWTQAGAGAGADAANNTEHQTAYPTLPNAYRD